MKRDFVVGLLFFVAMGVLLTVTAITSNVDFGRERKYLNVHFDDVRGLRTGNKVRIAGLDVGIVQSLELSPEGQVNAVLKVAPEVTLLAGEDVDGERVGAYQILVRDLSLLGGKFVDIDQGDRGSEVVSYDALQGLPAPEFLKDLSEVVDENRASFRNIIDRVEKVTERLDEGDGLLPSLINEPAWTSQVGNILANVEDLTEILAGLAADLEAGKGTLGKILRRDELYNDLQALADNLNQISDKVNNGNGVVAKLINDEEMAEDFEAVVDDVRDITAHVSDGPGALTMVIKDEGFRDDLRGVASGAREVVDKANNGNGAISLLLNDEGLATDAEETFAEVRQLVEDLRGSEGVLGMLISDTDARDELRDVISEAQRAIVELRESIEDTREQAPISQFTGILFSAF